MLKFFTGPIYILAHAVNACKTLYPFIGSFSSSTPKK
jgi:hypothetical protein